jgi:predicted acylesterase/phospholipase RssA
MQEKGRRQLRELRLAVVMNGGISLAVWMAGVTAELNSLRLARRGSPPPEREASSKAWLAILAAAHTNVTIDLVAGASAGGLNGVVLARSIAMNQELPRLKMLWLERASLSFGKLLGWPPGKPGVSLLNGDYFHDQVRKLLAEETAVLPEVGIQPPTVTLLVTATALPLKGQAVDSVDVDEGDSRRVYRFASRPGLDADFGRIVDLPKLEPVHDFVNTATLALAARASASFPGAFQPVEETNALQRQQLGVDLPSERWLMDGGVLDNAPFEPVLDDLRARAVGEDFDRVLLYVNPSTPAANKQQRLGSTGPGILKTLAGVVTAWREPDRRIDRERLAETTLAARFTVSEPHLLLASLYGSSDRRTVDPEDLASAAAALFVQYQTGRWQALQVAATGVDSEDNTPHDQLMTKLANLVPATCSPQNAVGWQWGLTAADRILRWWGRALRSTSEPGQHQPAFDALRPAQEIVQHWLDLFEPLQASNAGDVTKWCDAAAKFFADHRLPQLLAALMNRTAESVAGALAAASGAQLLQSSVQLEVVTRATSWRSDKAGDVAPFDYWLVTPAGNDPCQLAPPDIAPEVWATHKLYGEQWAHFGAFASKDGRAWDWMWGRLDAAMSLSADILKAAQVPQTKWLDFQQPLAEAILTEEGTSVPDLHRRGARMIDLSALTLLLEWVGVLQSGTRVSTPK